MCVRRWYLGIQSKKDPAHVMNEVYKAMQALKCVWYQVNNYRVLCLWKYTSGVLPPQSPSPVIPMVRTQQQPTAVSYDHHPFRNCFCCNEMLFIIATVATADDALIPLMLMLLLLFSIMVLVSGRHGCPHHIRQQRAGAVPSDRPGHAELRRIAQRLECLQHRQQHQQRPGRPHQQRHVDQQAPAASRWR